MTFTTVQLMGFLIVREFIPLGFTGRCWLMVRESVSLGGRQAKDINAKKSNGKDNDQCSNACFPIVHRIRKVTVDYKDVS